MDTFNRTVERRLSIETNETLRRYGINELGKKCNLSVVFKNVILYAIIKGKLERFTTDITKTKPV